jgi:thiol:disulfide interchange protein DsbD
MKTIFFILMLMLMPMQSNCYATEIDQKTLIIFSADWCKSCVIAERDMKKNKDTQKLLENYHLVYANFDKNEDLTSHYKVKKIPTFIILNEEAEEIERLVGYLNIDKLNVFLLRHKNF